MEWRYIQGVQDVLGSMAWKKTEDGEGGITWIELYAVYMIHGGAELEKRKTETDPLSKPQQMQMQLADFKRAVRQVKKHSVQEDDEWHFDTSYVMRNRLEEAAIENKQAAIKGTPCINEEDGKASMRLILALRG